MVKKYQSPLRQEQAAQTRDRIAAAARAVFVEHGYAAATIGAVAAAAGVSEPTVYRVFGSKRGILMALLDQMGRQAADAEVAARERDPGGDPREQLRVEVDHIVGVFADWIDFAQVILNVGASDPAVAAVGREGDRRRYARQAPLVRRWHRNGVLRQGLSARRAGEILGAMTGPEMFALMTRTNGWSVRDFRSWLAAMLERELFA